MKKMRVFILFALLSPSILWAQAFRLTYSEGDIHRQGNRGLEEMMDGDTVQQNDVLILGTGSVAIIEGNSVRLFLTKPGNWSIEKLLEQQSQTDLLSVRLTSIASKLIGAAPRRGETVLGVRNAAAANLSDPILVEAQDFLNQGLKYLELGDPEKAAAPLFEALDLSDEDLESTILFYLGLTYDLLDEKIEALSLVEDIEPDDLESELQDAFYYLHSRLLFDVGDYEGALEYTEEYQVYTQDTENKQALLMVKALTHQALGNSSLSLETWRQIAELDEMSEIGSLARTRL